MSNELIKVWHADDPDPSRCGLGLAFAPFLKEKIGGLVSEYWMMSPSEQMAMIFLLESLKPKVAIEIGTRLGGSLQVLAHFAEKVYSLDIDPEVPLRLKGKHDNVEYIIGDSRKTLPALIDRLQQEDAALSFVLIDGDHSAEGVQADVDSILGFRPTVPLYVVMHDSSNPVCRKGLMAGAWSESPYVHALELDFVMGVAHPSPSHWGDVWGGLSLAILLPEKRQGRFAVSARGKLTWEWLPWGMKLQKIAKRLRRFYRRN